MADKILLSLNTTTPQADTALTNRSVTALP